MLKLSENPPMLSCGAASVAEMDGRWWVAHTKARFEKAFAWDLLRRGVGYFLPLVEKVSIRHGRKRRALLPLFPSYVFFCGDAEVRSTAMTTNRLCRVIDVTDQQKLVGEFVPIERALSGKAKLDLHPFAAVGRRCRITAGPFEGIEGKVIQRRETTRIVLEISVLGQGACMEIDADLLRPV